MLKYPLKCETYEKQIKTLLSSCRRKNRVNLVYGKDIRIYISFFVKKSMYVFKIM